MWETLSFAAAKFEGGMGVPDGNFGNPRFPMAPSNVMVAFLLMPGVALSTYIVRFTYNVHCINDHKCMIRNTG